MTSAPSTSSVCGRLRFAYEQMSGTPSLPAYSRIERCIQQLIADNTFGPGQRLPTVRELAQALGIATNTAAHAYSELANQGAIVSRAGGGSSVAIRDRSAPSSGEGQQAALSSERLRRSARHLVAYGLALGYAPAELLHAVRAELAAIGRADPNSDDRAAEIRTTLPMYAVPADAVRPTDTLSIAGCVRQPCSVATDQIRQFPRVDLEQPFTCEEGWVVPSLRWSGVRLHDVLSLAQPLSRATLVRVGAGSYWTPLSMADARSAVLADELDGAPLCVEHGAPWRLVAPARRVTQVSSGSTTWKYCSNPTREY